MRQAVYKINKGESCLYDSENLRQGSRRRCASSPPHPAADSAADCGAVSSRRRPAPSGPHRPSAPSLLQFLHRAYLRTWGPSAGDTIPSRRDSALEPRGSCSHSVGGPEAELRLRAHRASPSLTPSRVGTDGRQAPRQVSRREHRPGVESEAGLSEGLAARPEVGSLGKREGMFLPKAWVSSGFRVTVGGVGGRGLQPHRSPKAAVPTEAAARSQNCLCFPYAWPR